jgi:hypothetical protein
MKTAKIHGILAGVAFAVIGVSPGVHAQASNTIYACVNNSSGQVSIVSAGTVCPNNSTPKSWNIVGPTGATGPAGPTGATGPAGPAGVSGYEIVQSATTLNVHSGAYVLCPTGKVVTGGGFNNSANSELHASYPVGVGGQAGWYVQAGATVDDGGVVGDVYAICVNASP